MEDEVFVFDFSCVEFLPEDDLEIFLWAEEGEDFDAHGGEDDVGVADAVEGDAEEDECGD